MRTKSKDYTVDIRYLEVSRKIESCLSYRIFEISGSSSIGSSATAMLKELNWDTLESRRTLFQLKYVHKMFSSQVALHPLTILKETCTVV